MLTVKIETSFLKAVFDNTYIKSLPGEEKSHNTPRMVEGCAWSRVKPHFFSKPQLIAFSMDLAHCLDLLPVDFAKKEFDEIEKQTLALVFTGQKLLPGMQPWAMNYGGHQFGQWAAQLGDGRAINLGQLQTKHYGSQTLQLKGAGPTPYSRRGDGFAVLRSSLREFLCSEAMYYLGIKTTRALSLCLTGEKVPRDMFYDGKVEYELGAIVCRVSPSFIRFGHFQLPASRKEMELLQQLANYTIYHNYHYLWPKEKNNQLNQKLDKEIYLSWYAEICQRSIEMVIHWMRVGFVHGVINTDNMSILGETIDYGPYGWLEEYESNWTPNITDFSMRRYAYAQQTHIVLWNLVQLANAIYLLIDDVYSLQNIIQENKTKMEEDYFLMLGRKLGLDKETSHKNLSFIKNSLKLLENLHFDFTNFFRNLIDFKQNHFKELETSFFSKVSYNSEKWTKDQIQFLKKLAKAI